MTSRHAADSAHQSSARSRRTSRWLRRFLVLLFTLILVVTAAAGFLIGTEPGLRALYALSQRVMPGMVQIADLEGSVWEGPVLHRVKVQAPEAEVHIERLALVWHPMRLWDRELQIQSLRLDSTRVILHETEPKPETEFALPDIALPLRFTLGELALNGVRIEPASDAEPLTVERLELAATWEGHDLELERLQVDTEAPIKGRVAVVGRVALRERYPLNVDLDWRLDDRDLPEIQGKGHAEGDLTLLRVGHESQGVLSSRLEAEISDLLGAIGWQIRLDLDTLALRDLDDQLPEGEVSGHAEAEGMLESLTARSKVNGRFADVADLGLLHGEIELSFGEGRLRVGQLQLSASETDARLSAHGEVELKPGEGPGEVDAQLQWRDLGWPPAGEAQYASPEGELHVRGTLDAYSHDLKGSISGRDLPPTVLRGQGTGDAVSLSFDALELTLLEGVVKGHGDLRWDPELAWDFDLVAERLQPGRQWPAVEGTVGFSLATRGQVAEREEASVEIADLLGELNDRPLAGSALAHWRNDGLLIERLDLAVGPNHLHLSGQAADLLDLKVSLDAPEISVLAPGAAGAVKLDATVAGKPERPEIDARLDAKALKVGDAKLANAAGHVRIAADAQGLMDIDLQAQGLAVAGLGWDRATVTATGSPVDHGFKVLLDGQPLAVLAEGKAALADDGGYSGTFHSLELKAPEAGGWRLAQTAEFGVTPSGWRLGRACFASSLEYGKACVETEGSDPGDWRAVVDVPRLALDILGPFLPEGVDLEGEARFAADLNASASRLSGTARLDVPSGTSSVELDAGVQKLDFSGAVLEAVAGTKGIDAVLDLPFGGLGQMKGTLELKNWSLDAPLRPEQPLRAGLKGRISDLSPLMAVVPQLSAVQGAIDVDLDIAGTLGSNRLGGELRLDGAAFDIPAAGVAVSEMSVVARSRDAEALDYEGTAKLGEGIVTLSGQTRVTKDRGLATDVSLKGERLKVVDIPEATMLVTPDLTFSMDRERVELKGVLEVPEARLRPRSLPEGSVSSSPDVVIKGQETGDANLRLMTAADVRLKLGDKVSFDGFGLRGFFRGDLRVTQEPGRLALGNGQLFIEEGTFATFGEELTIEQGRLLFANTPVYNPAVNIVAKREFTDATVGARVAGTLKKPAVTFFADPPMGQAEALNYLITGGASRGGGVSGASVVGGNLIVKKLGERIGLEDVGVTQNEDTENLSVYVGTYLSPQLYMQYVSEMGEAANKIRLRYDLTKKIQVEAETGDVQSADIFYTFER